MYRINDVELASRLSFFLWSSIPDDELLDLAVKGKLKDPAVLTQQVRRMLADVRSEALIKNFAGQWLYLRNVPDKVTDGGVFPDFEGSLRGAFLRETEMFFDSILRNEHVSVLELLRARYTFLNQQLAQYYGITNVYGRNFRRVDLTDDVRIGGLLGQGSFLLATSYPTRTAPTVRGKWIMSTLLGIPPPEPPPNIPALPENSAGQAVSNASSVRARLERHRASPNCAGCHKLMDPLGLALENFDAIGRWRTKAEDGTPVDPSTELFDGATVNGPAAVRDALLKHPESIVRTTTERLLTYALGRGTEDYDYPAIRKIVKDAGNANASFTNIIVGIASSVPFQMRRCSIMITKWRCPGGQFLRGLGATIALPLLDAMVPALTPLVKAAGNPVRRLGFFYFPNGKVDDNRWTPASEGRLELSPILSAFAPVQQKTVVLTGLCQKMALPMGDGNGDHSRATSTWLNGVHPKKTESGDVRGGTTADQVAAAVLGKDTPLASLELGLDGRSIVGACENGYSCVYPSTISWRTPTQPLLVENNPGVVFERMFGDGGSSEQRRLQMRNNRSILDSVTEEFGRLQRGLGAADRTLMGEYVESVREVEQRIQRAERAAEIAVPPERPFGIPLKFGEHLELMFDLQVLAYRTDITRVVTFLMAQEVSNRTYPECGVPGGHHGVSHHGGNPEMMAQLARINAYHALLFSKFVQRLDSLPDGDGSLLDHSLILYGGGLGDGNGHTHFNLPAVLFGGPDLLKGGRHIKCAEPTPMGNLLLTMLDKVGVPTRELGDSAGQLAL